MSVRAAACVLAATVSLLMLGQIAPALGSSQAGPVCTPSTLNNAAVLGGSVTVSPVPGSRDASAQTQISFLGVPAATLRVRSVTGSRSGTHPGRLLAYSQGDGASFLPSRPFVEGERVSVRAQVRRGAAVIPLVDVFSIAQQDPISSTPERIYPGAPSEIQGFHSRPHLRPPAVAVTEASPAVAPGDEFLAPYAGPGQAGPMILDPAGALLWFKTLPARTSAANFQLQQYLGRPVLTWWQGDISEHGFGLGEDVIADQTYTDIAHVRAGNGYRADLHEFQLTPQGTALITAYDPILCRLSQLGGPAYGAVTDALIQDIDVSTGLVRFQWTSLDHVPLEESNEPASKSTTSWPFDFAHLNSIAREQDGSLIVSARNTWTTYDIDRRTGQVLWRVGGRHTTFALQPGSGTAFQHDSRQLPDGTISMFDNGASPKIHAQSRGVVLRLDPQGRTATLVAELVHPSPLVAESQGNMQLLANGDWFIGWGQAPFLSEFSPVGALLFDAHMPLHTQSYRAFRFPWQGTPAHPPTFVVEPAPGGSSTVYASWNGATAVAAWRVLAGASATTMQSVAEAPRSGFETAITIGAPTTGTDVTVQALDASGSPLATAQPKAFGG